MPPPGAAPDVQAFVQQAMQAAQSFAPANVAAIAASAAAAAVQAASPAPASEDKDKDKSKEEGVRPWTDGDQPAFSVDGLHPDELRFASLPLPRRNELSHDVCDYVQQQLYEHADSFVQDAQDPLVLDPLISQMIMVNGGDTAMGNVIRTVRVENGLGMGVDVPNRTVPQASRRVATAA